HQQENKIPAYFNFSGYMFQGFMHIHYSFLFTYSLNKLRSDMQSKVYTDALIIMGKSRFSNVLSIQSGNEKDTGKTRVFMNQCLSFTLFCFVIIFCHLVPIDDIPECGNIFRAFILIFQIVSMLPHV